MSTALARPNDLADEIVAITRKYGEQPDPIWVDCANLLQQHYTPPPVGRPSKLGEAETIALLLHKLAQGNHRSHAAYLSGLSRHTLDSYIDRGRAKEFPFSAFLDIVEKAESYAVDSLRGKIHAAADDPRFWTAAMTWLERKYPDLFGQRREDNNVPKVIVQIGARDSDIRILTPSPTTFALIAPSQGAVSD